MLFIGTPPYIHTNTENFCSQFWRDATNENGIIKNNDGSLSVFILNENNVKTPQEITKTCCDYYANVVTGEEHFFDLDTRKCKWSTTAVAPIAVETCSVDIPFKVILNPKGNDGNIFFSDGDETCSLVVDFDYLFKFDCTELRNLILRHPATPEDKKFLASETDKAKKAYNDQLVVCAGLNTQLTQKQNEYTNTPYSVSCPETIQTGLPLSIYDVQLQSNPFLIRPRTIPISGSTLLTVFGTTGFGSRSPYTRSSGFPSRPRTSFTLIKHYCITDPKGLTFWKTQLGDTNYQKFINGDSTSYTCNDVQRLITNGTPGLFTTCNIPFGTKNKLKKELDVINDALLVCNAKTDELSAAFLDLQDNVDDEITICETPVGVLENLDVYVNIEVVNTGGTLDSVFFERFFPAIGQGELYDYLKARGSKSGFYMCGQPLSNETWTTGCTPIKLTSQNNAETLFGEQHVNVAYCDSVNDNMLAALFVEARVKNPALEFEAFVNTLNIDALNSDWLHYHHEFTDQAFIQEIANKKLKLSLTFSSSCDNVSVLIDQISMDKVCFDRDVTITVFDKSPGFNLERVIDNKKSWLNNDTLVDREFLISNSQGNNIIRRTDYDSSDERLIVNSKEIDLAINIAKAVETDVWCYISDNPCLLTGTTALNPCMSCNTATIDIDALLTTEVSAITTIEGFENTFISELIDVKNRKVIQSYPTLKALYERYLNSSAYCPTVSSAFNYYSMEQFVSLLGNYWVDLIEQVVPSTAIWDSVKIYTNTIFDQQKFRYKPYRLFYGSSPFVGFRLSNPINGTSGVCANVEVKTTTLVGPLTVLPNILQRAQIPVEQVNIFTNPITGQRLPIVRNSGFVVTGPSSFRPVNSFNSSIVTRRIPTTYSSVCISQFNTGSEFIGSVTIQTNSLLPFALQPIGTPFPIFNPNVANLITE